MISFFCFSFASTSRGERRWVQPVVGFGFENGGALINEELGRTDFTLEAGRGFSFFAGALFPYSQTQPQGFELQVTLGAKFVSLGNDETGTISWRRWPLEIINYYRDNRSHFRLGWGLTRHFRSSLHGENSKSTATTEFNEPTGWILNPEWLFESGDQVVAVGIRYTRIDYLSERFRSPINGNSWGVGFAIFSK